LLDITIDGARGVLFNITGGPDLTLFEVNQAAAIIRETSHPDVNLIFGAVIDPNMGDEVRITVIATGFERGGLPRRILERPTTTRRTEPISQPVHYIRPLENVSVGAVREPKVNESYKSTPPATYGSDNLDIPTFLRNRR
jgi:cell division protein FtsZ